MKNLVATVSGDFKNLERYADSVNNGTTSGISFYVNGNRVSVSAWHYQMSEYEQREMLTCFLQGKKFEIN